MRNYFKPLILCVALVLAACSGEKGNDGESAPVEYQATVVVQWNDVMLSAIRNSGPRPTVVARQMFLVHSAMYDAWSLYSPVANPTALNSTLRRPALEHTDANKAEAVSQAAYQMLVKLFPTYEANTGDFLALLKRQGYNAATDQTNATSPSGVGFAAAIAVTLQRANDGSNALNNYGDVISATYPSLYTAQNSPVGDRAPGGVNFNRNAWQPLRVPTGTLKDSSGNPIVDNNVPSSYKDQLYLTPHWGAVTPFALTSGAQFRPSAPPVAGDSSSYTDGLGHTSTNDEAFRSQLDQVLSISASLTDKQKVIAEYWADGPRSETPPGHWNRIAQAIAFRDKHSIDSDVKLFFALEGGLLDSSIAAWEAKRHYNFVRPISAIKHEHFSDLVNAWAGPNLGTKQIEGKDWQPYQSATFVTPPFPEYVSGHSTFSASSAEILTQFTGSTRYYDGTTIVPFDEDKDGQRDRLGEFRAQVNSNHFELSPTTLIVLRWDSFQDAANEAGISRLYGGIHFQDGDLRARVMGKNIGAQAFTKARNLWNGTAAP